MQADNSNVISRKDPKSVTLSSVMIKSVNPNRVRNFVCLIAVFSSATKRIRGRTSKANIEHYKLEKYNIS